MVREKEMVNMEKIVIASQNKHKIIEINSVLKDFGMEGISLADIEPDLDIVEDGNTFEKNSYIKAETVMKRLNCIALADDSGLEVNALNGRPGVYSARFAGENASDEDNNKKLIKELEGVEKEYRTARYVCVITMVFPNGKKIVAKGSVEGHIAFEKSGKQGFGYDPYFIPKGYDKTFGHFSLEEKNQISHRAKALQELRKLLEK